MTAYYNVYQQVRKDTHPGWIINAADNPGGNCVPNGVYGPFEAPIPDTSTTDSYDDFHISESRSVSPERSWRKIRTSGVVSMTPHRRSRTTTTNYVAGRYRFSAARFSNACGTAKKCYFAYSTGSPLLGEWREQRSFDGWSRTYGSVNGEQIGFLQESWFDDKDVQRAIKSTQSSVVSEFLQGYDVLTELAESREALAFVKSTTTALPGFLKTLFRDIPADEIRKVLKMTPRSLMRSADRKLQAVGRMWMAYRYAVMPLVYSYRDINKMLNGKKTVYKTYKANETVSIRDDSKPSFSGTRIVKTTSGTIKVRSSIKAGFASEAAAAAQGVSFNPFATAWELIPMSFVCDWFLNVGDYIVSRTSADLSSSVAMCTSVRRTTTENFYLEDRFTWSKAYPVYVNDKCGVVAPAYSDVRETDTREILRTVQVDSYDRFLFSASDVSLGLNSSFMNWKRTIDAFVLSYNPAKKLLKSFL